MSDRALQRVGLALFATSVALIVASLLLGDGLNGRPGLAKSDGNVDYAFLVNTGALATAALLVTWARPRNSVGWLLGASGVIGVLCAAAQLYGERALVVPGSDLPLGRWVLALSAPLWVPALLIPATVLLVRYPSGDVAPGRWPRRLDHAVWVGFVTLYVAYAAGDNAVSDEVKGGTSPIDLPSWLGAVLGVIAAVTLFGGLVGIVVLTVVRTLRATAPERQQLALLLTASTFGVAFVIVSPSQLAGSFAFLLIPTSIVVGVLRYRLLGIELVVRRTLLYAALTGLVLGVFVGVTALVNVLAPTGPVPQIVAAVIVAVAVVPLRSRLQSWVDRFVYGDRRDPFSTLARMSGPVAGEDSELLPGVVEAVGRALRVRGVAIDDPHGAALASWGEPDVETETVALRKGGAVVGALRVSPRIGERHLTAADRRLLEMLAPMVAVVVRSVRLAADLDRERQRVLDATQAERGRLRQDLHDGLGPSLTGVGLGLEALDVRLADSDERDRLMVARLRAEIAGAVEDVRRIIDDLRPTALDDADLVSALRARAANMAVQGGLQVDVDVASSLPPLTAEVEITAYRVVDEALTNVLRHTKASRCQVVVAADDALRLEVHDDGVGLSDQRAAHGVGLDSMRQRTEQLGGRFIAEATHRGTRVIIELPLVTT